MMEAWAANWDYRAIVERHFDENILDFSIRQKHVLSDMTAMETSRRAGGGARADLSR
ncbi:hypothetical protein I6F35_23860 [Bradyrhizobium sp. BRP22]|uniref:hypothetical protein n=1 Tax=Bradyrhizobium sp. BRP22 TaxID=2793821 RepID=UPI001CD51601|nr:hypothetical protein [Bradyrhizobium sp. BRP22]MCA1456206.1 hypothetical protein [Bradyrhizobium sp. BRP22]